MKLSHPCLAIPLAMAGAGAVADATLAQVPVTRVSVASDGTEADLDCYSPVLSADGRFVAFYSPASNLVAGDTNGLFDVFVHDRATGATVRVSVDSAGVEADGDSFAPALSRDGRFVSFVSDASNLVQTATNSVYEVFVHDRDPDGNGIFDEGNGTTELVSVDSNGVPAGDFCWSAAISADGSRVAFASSATNLVGSADTNGASDVFVHDRTTGSTTRVSVRSNGVEGNGASYTPSISDDGTIVAFGSFASNLVVGDRNRTFDVFLHDLTTGKTTRVSVDSAGGESDGDSIVQRNSLSGDGRFVTFSSGADDLVANDTNFIEDVFLHDGLTGTTTRISVSSNGVEGDGFSLYSSISADGSVVVFASGADNLAPVDVNGGFDVFLHDVLTGETTLISRNRAGASANSGSSDPTVSADGNLVCFDSAADDLIRDDTNGLADVFVLDRSVVPPQASWSNYGSGYAGTLGIPTLVSDVDPEFGATVTLTASDSAAQWSVALLVVGLDRASIPTTAGGTLLVDPLLWIACALPPIGLSLVDVVPYDVVLCDAPVRLQALELDPGAPHGLSFTPGLELVFGQ